MKAIIVIPTYDEKDNVRPMAEAILSTPQYPNTSTPQYPNISTPQYPNTSTPQLELLFVDDNSPDGTGRIVDEMSAHDPRIHCLHRTKKEGLGRAYIAGFERALELGADFIIQMDCDFSHDPKDIPRLLEAISSNTSKPQNLKTSKPQNTETSKPKNLETQKLRNSETSKPQNPETSKPQDLKTSRPQDPPPTPDLVIGSRYVKGGSTPGWPFKRRLISRAGGIFIRTITGMPLRDPTGGFKCWKASTLRQLDLATIESAGYSFQLEMNHRTWKRGLSIQEIPIVFHDRELGYSKITPGIAVESIKIALHLRFS